MISQKEDFSPNNACMVVKLLIINDFTKFIARYDSSIAPLNNISSTRIIEIEQKNILSDYPVSFLNCSPDGKHLYYKKKDPKSAEVVESGVAELNSELVALPLQKDSVQKSEHRIIGWLEPSSLLYLYSSKSSINEQNGTGVESYLFSYPSGENKIHPSFLEKPRLFDMSPDFKQVAYVSDGKIQISDTNGNNVRDILDFSKLLPKGEVFISDY